MAQETETQYSGDIFSSALMVAPPNQIAEITGNPDVKGTLVRNRLEMTGLRIADELLEAFSTYALLNIQNQPGLYAATIGAQVSVDARSYRVKGEFNREILSTVRRRLISLTPYIGLINTELRDRGYTEAYHWKLWYSVQNSEKSKHGLEKTLSLAHPLLQGIAASKNISLPLAITSTVLSYALIPVFSKFGEKTSQLNDRSSFIEEGRDRAEFYGAGRLKNLLKERSDQTWEKRNRYRYFQVFLNRLPQIGFLLAATIAKTEAVGIFSYLRQLITTPSTYWSMKEDELDIKRDLGYIANMHDIMSGHPYLLTKESWDKYRRNKLETMEKIKFTNGFLGIETIGLQTHIPDKTSERLSPSLTAKAERGQVLLLSANSGEGKSVTTGFGMAGLVPTDGYFIFHDDNESITPLESLGRDEVDQRVLYVSSSHDYDEIRIVDIYQRRAIEEYISQAQRPIEELSEMELLMLSIPDALLERELYSLAHKMIKEGSDRSQWYGYNRPEDKKMVIDGIEPVFPTDMFDQIHTFRQMRNNLVASMLQTRGANFKSIVADEPIGHLSTGMKIRFLFELNRELRWGENNPDRTKLIIFDEPFGSLDEQNAREYLELIKEMLDQKNPPVIVLISHTQKNIIHQVLDEKIVTAKFEN